MTTVLKHGVQQGIQARSSPPHAAPLVRAPLTRVLQSFTVNPLASPPANFTYRMGNVYVKYSVQLIVVVPPPIHGTTPRSTIAGRLLNPLFLTAWVPNVLLSVAVHGLPAGAKYLIEQDICGGGHKVMEMEMVMIVVVIVATFDDYPDDDDDVFLVVA
jgi:hypothetical protein